MTMNVKIGVADAAKLVELEVEDVEAFRKTIDAALIAGGMAWFTDTKGRDIGIPAARIAFVEVENSDAMRKVGFGPAST